MFMIMVRLFRKSLSYLFSILSSRLILAKLSVSTVRRTSAAKRLVVQNSKTQTMEFDSVLTEIGEFGPWQVFYQIFLSDF